MLAKTSPRLAQPSSRQLLARILDEPGLVATIRALEPRALGKLIRHVGLEDSGEIVSLATTEQLKEIFDDDLWKSERPGKDESFDADRFALWLEVMLEAGEDFAAEKLIDLPEELFTFALHRRALVISVDPLGVETDTQGDYLTDKAIEGCLQQEICEYTVIARQHDGWDTLVAILLAIDTRDHEFLERVLERCFAMSSEYIEENGGLYEVLTSDELLEADLAGDREDRRAEKGFVAPSSAASFLALCRLPPPKDVLGEKRDPIIGAYFRDLAASPGGDSAPEHPRALGSGGAADDVASLEQLIATLEEDDLPRRAKARLPGKAEDEAAASEEARLFERALAALAVDEPTAHAQRLEELAFLCNVLVGGCEIDGRSFRPYEAALAAAATCNLGLEALLGQGQRLGIERATALLARGGAEKIFHVGFHRLHRDVSLAACAAVARGFASRARAATGGPRRLELERGAKFVQEKLAQGKPWLARSRLPDLHLDDETQEAVTALLGELPFLVGPLATSLGRHGDLEGAFGFVASGAQVGRVAALLERL